MTINLVLKMPKISNLPCPLPQGLPVHGNSAALSAVHLLEWRNGTCPLIHPHSNYYC